MDTNGTLRTDAPFDYESYQSLTYGLQLWMSTGHQWRMNFVAITDVNYESGTSGCLCRVIDGS